MSKRRNAIQGIHALAFLLAFTGGATADPLWLGPSQGDSPSFPTTNPPEAENLGHGSYRPPETRCLDSRQRAVILYQLDRSRVSLTLSGVLSSIPTGPMAPVTGTPKVQLRWPIRAQGAAAADFEVHGISNFVDQDPQTSGSKLDYNCGLRTYDQHKGIDIFSWPFGWLRMAADEVEIVAAARGMILLKANGNADQSCPGNTGPAWNAVYVQHMDGSVAWYGHLKNNSLTTKVVGQWVDAGEFLGVMGSSGNSTGPHLHLEMYDATGTLMDPFKGTCNSLGSDPTWLEQRPYYDSGVNRIQVGDAVVSFNACPEVADPHAVSSLPRGALGYFTTFYRDQLSTTPSIYRIRYPNGNIMNSWIHAPGQAHFAASWWWWSWFIPANGPVGTWSFEVEYEGETYSTSFDVF